MDTRHPPTLILASGSPRRSSVLELLGLEFTVRIPEIDETVRPGEEPEDLSERLARGKAESGAAAGGLSLGFDTIVGHRGDILGKPGSPEEAVEMIERLAGETHHVFTGIAIAVPGRTESTVEKTAVRFRRIGPGEAAAYVATGEPMDKAGAYGIQGLGASLVAGVDGDFFNVMGFPVQPFQRLLERYGWRYQFGALFEGDGPDSG